MTEANAAGTAKGPGIVLQPEEGESYWQPVWANGYSTESVANSIWERQLRRWREDTSAGLMRCGRFIRMSESTLSGTTSETHGRGTPAFVSTICSLACRSSIVDRLIAADVDRQVRSWEKTSDHAPTWIELGNAGKDRARRRRGPMTSSGRNAG